jgi:hypothetical protein
MVGATSGIQGQLNLKAPLASPTFTGNTYLPNTTYINNIIIGDATNFYQKPGSTSSPLFSKASVSSITIPIGFKYLVNNVFITTSGITTLSLNSNLDTGSKVAGTDYYVYALEAGGFIISANNTYPTGYTASNSRKIGGFHYGVIPESFTAINNINSADAAIIAGINANSMWDLKFRFIGGDNRGMHKMGNRWYDIYLLNSEHVTNGTSKAGGTIAAGGTSYGRALPKIPLAFGGTGSNSYSTFTWFEAAEIANAYGKDLISYKEFVSLAYGVLEASSSGNSSGTIGHDANYTSKWGTCQVTGYELIWGSNLSNYPTDATWAWRANTGGRGSIYSTENSPTAVRLGGVWSDGSVSGSRYSSWNIYLWNGSLWHIGCRCCGDHLELV